MESKDQRGYRTNEYGNVHVSMLNTAAKYLVDNVRECLKHWLLEEVTVQQFVWSSAERRNAVIEMLRSVFNIWTLPSVRRRISQLEKGGFGRMWRTHLNL